MPITYYIDRDQRLVVATPQGVLTDADVFGYQQDVWSCPDTRGYDELIDMTGVSRIEFVSADRVSRLAELSGNMDSPVSPSKLAIIATADFLEHEYRSRAETFMNSRVTLQLPFLLSAVLSRISRLDEFFEELGRIRLKTANLRKRRAELDRQINEGNKQEIEKLRAAVADEARRVTNSYEKIAIAGIAGSVVALGAAQLGLGGVESLALPAFLVHAFAEGVVHLGADEMIEAAGSIDGSHCVPPFPGLDVYEATALPSSADAP